jgi:GAF domain-containing protein
LSVLDLGVVHHEVLQSALPAGADDEELARLVRAAADFFLESVSAFEMVQRGFREAREAALVERRQAAMLRQLSTFLADASLALDAPDSLEEMLRLVAEQVRELTGARCCIAMATLDGKRRPIQAASYPEADPRWPALLSSIDLGRIDPLVPPAIRATRLSSSDVMREAGASSSVHEKRGLDGWLSAPLTTLDGRRVGLIHVIDKDAGDFTELDEAVVVHLAEMTSAALERARLYGASARSRSRP